MRNKSERGITLIALVITIIVLLILAGVTISTLIGENGLITKVNESRNKNEKESIKEQIKLSVLASKINEKGNLKINIELLEDEIKTNLGNNVGIDKKGDNGNLPWIISKNEYQFQIDEDGTVEKIEEVSGLLTAISVDDIMLDEGSIVKLTIITEPSKITEDLIYTSLNENVATVDENGNVTGVSAGTTTITVSGKETTTVQGTCTVTVNTVKKVEDLHKGEYVNYIDKNGKTVKCIVMYDYSDEEIVLEDDGFSTVNYGIQVISADSITTVAIGCSQEDGAVESTYTETAPEFEKARDSYNGEYTIFYNKAQEYLNTDYATHARCVGSSIYNSTWDDWEKVTLDYEFMEKYNGIFKCGNTTYKTDLRRLVELKIYDIGKKYWLDSRSDTVDDAQGNGDIYVNFDMLYMSSGSKNPYVASIAIIGNDTRLISKRHEYGFRAIFTLRPEIKIKDGTGIKDDPYVLY